MTLPLPVAIALGPIIAGTVWRAGLLTTSGAIAAAIAGSCTALAGADWMLLLLAFFGSSVLLSRVGRETKRLRSGHVIDKSGPRDAMQVVANGGLFAIAAVCVGAGMDHPGVSAAALGAIAAAAADTWGTEIGMLSAAPPRSIRTLRPIEPGLSGGVSPLGLAATAAGALVIAILAGVLGWPRSIVIAGATAGIIGAMTDSLLGATMQERRRSLLTGRLTERHTDTDGSSTAFAGGLAWLTNDGVNLLATVTGAITSVVLHAWLAPRPA